MSDRLGELEELTKELAGKANGFSANASLQDRMDANMLLAMIDHQKVLESMNARMLNFHLRLKALEDKAEGK